MKTLLETSLFFGVAISIIGFFLGFAIRSRLKKAIFNPLLIAIAFVIGFLLLTGISYEKYNTGAKYLSYLLTPATVCLAIPLYRQIELLRKNVKAILLGILSGVAASLISVLALSWMFGLTHELYVTLLPKSITTAIGMGVSQELGGIVTLTVAVIILTGLIGNMIAEFVCHIFRIDHPIARGIAIGTSAHAVGTAKAIEMGETEGAMSGLAITVAGLMTVLVASVFANLI